MKTALLNLSLCLEVAGTPGFFINGVFLSGAQPQAEFERVIENQLALIGRRQSATK